MTPNPNPEVPMTANAILEQLDHYFLHAIGGRVAAASLSKDEWIALGLCDTADGRFGWTWPHTNPTNEDEILVAYCPEIIAEITAHLSAEGRQVYLDGVEFLCAGVIAHGLTLDIRQGLVSQLQDRFPGTANLMADVHERAIQVRIVPDSPGGEVTEDPVCSQCGFVSKAGTVKCPLDGMSLT